MRTLAVLLLATLPAPALAQEGGTSTPVESTAHRHLGFFLRADLGAGYLHSRASQSGATESVSSVSIPLGLALGAAVAENWILGAELWFAYGPTPSISLNSTSTSPSDSRVFLGNLGLAVVHYFMPANVYVSLAPGVSRVELTLQGNTARTSYGFGGKLAVGKEWWVSDHWGIGLAIEALFAINQDSGTNPPTWTTLGGGLTFSATFN